MQFEGATVLATALKFACLHLIQISKTSHVTNSDLMHRKVASYSGSVRWMEVIINNFDVNSIDFMQGRRDVFPGYLLNTYMYVGIVCKWISAQWYGWANP